MPRYLMSVYGPAERGEYGDYPSKACRGEVEVRPFQTEESVKAMLGS